MERKLSEVCWFYSGTGFPVTYQGKDKGELPFYKVGDISNNVAAGNMYLSCCNNYISRQEATEIKGSIIPPYTIVFAKIGEALKLNRRVITNCDCLIDNNVMGIKPNRDYLRTRYFYYYMKRLKMQDYAESTAVPSVRKSKLEQIKIDIPSLEEQERMEQALDKASAIIIMRQQQLQKLDELVKARFVEMFGDMLLNDMAWQESTLDTLADVVSGITKGRRIRETELIEVPYMAVSNVKDGYIDWTTVKTIEATEQEINQYRLLPDDVLMTEGGDPDKLGRGAIIKKPLENCIHQNHIFRVRLNESVILPSFFAEYLKHQKAKRYFLGCAKQTTGIASINMRQLKALPVLLPPLQLQRQFSVFVEQTDKSKAAVQKALDETQLLFDSLMQKYFG